MTDAIIGYIKVKEAAAVQPYNMSHSLSVEMEQFIQSQSSKEKIVVGEADFSGNEEGGAKQD